MTTPTPRTLVVVCADWPVIAAGFPADHHEPVAVVHANRIIATNAAARAADVHAGLRRREAQRRCPDARLIAHDPARDARRFEAVAAALATLTPRVEITQPGVCSFATRGPSRYFGGDEALAERAMRLTRAACHSIDDNHFSVDNHSSDDNHSPSDNHFIDGSPTATPSAASAHVAVRVAIADGPLVAHLAAQHAPAGVPHVVAPGESVAFLAPLPLRALVSHVPDPELLTTWHQLGLVTLGDLAALPASAVLGRFGDAGMWVHHLAHGRDPRMLVPLEPPPDLAVTSMIDPPARRSDLIGFTARAAADELVERLAARGLSCLQVAIALHSDHEETHERSWRLDGPARPDHGARSLAAAIADRARWQVDGWLGGPAGSRPTTGVARLVLSPELLEPAKGRQLGFWGNTKGADERVVRAVARLETLMGTNAVTVAEPQGGRHPGDEVEMVPTAAVDLSVPRTVAVDLSASRVVTSVDTAADHTAEIGTERSGRTHRGDLPVLDDPDTRRAGAPTSIAPPWPGRLPAPSPSVLLDPPQEAEVLDERGCVIEVDGRGEISAAPVTVRWGPPGSGASGLDHAVAAWAGPWPADERWWEGDDRRRQARVQVVTDQGAALLFSRRDQRWWLVAVYA